MADARAPLVRRLLIARFVCACVGATPSITEWEWLVPQLVWDRCRVHDVCALDVAVSRAHGGGQGHRNAIYRLKGRRPGSASQGSAGRTPPLVERGVSAEQRWPMLAQLGPDAANIGRMLMTTVGHLRGICRHLASTT